MQAKDKSQLMFERLQVVLEHLRKQVERLQMRLEEKIEDSERYRKALQSIVKRGHPALAARKKTTRNHYKSN